MRNVFRFLAKLGERVGILEEPRAHPVDLRPPGPCTMKIERQDVPVLPVLRSVHMPPGSVKAGDWYKDLPADRDARSIKRDPRWLPGRKWFERW